jgi:allantoin racemase
MAQLTREFGMPFVDGVASAIPLVEALVAAGLTTSKPGTYASPELLLSKEQLSDIAI